jgi:pentatricopeptide repeat protein
MRRARVSHVASHETSALPFLHPRMPNPSLFRRTGRRCQSTADMQTGGVATEGVSPEEHSSESRQPSMAYFPSSLSSADVLHSKMQPSPKPLTALTSRILHHSSCLRELDSISTVTPEHLDVLKQSVLSPEHRAHKETRTSEAQQVADYLARRLEGTHSWTDYSTSFISLSTPKHQLSQSSKDQTSVASLSEFDRLWTMHYASIRPKYDMSVPLQRRHDVLWTDPVAGERAAKLILAPPPPDIDMLSYMRATWDSPGLFSDASEVAGSGNDRLGGQKKLKIAAWRTMILWLLHHRPERAAGVLQATYTNPHPPFYMVADALEHLAGYYLLEHDKYTPVVAKSFRSALYTLLQECVESRPSLSQQTIFLVLTRSSLQGTHFFYNLLTNLDVHVSSDSLLQFAYVFGMHGDFERALDALADAIRVGADPASDVALSVCNKILRWSVVNPDGYHASAYIVSRLLEVGVHMNLPLHNVLMVNAIEAGDMKMALRVFDLLEENGVEPDSYTYSTLLKGCKQSGDLVTSGNILRTASEVALTTQDPWIATDILHLVYLQQSKVDDPTAVRVHASAIFAAIVPVYLRYFDAEVLLELRVISKRALGYHMEELNLTRSTMKPTVAAINIMLSAFLRIPNSNVERSFTQFTKTLFGGSTGTRRELAKQITKLAMDDFTFNAYLVAFSRRKEHLKQCTALVHLMSQGLPPDLLPRNPLTDEPIPPAKPTAQTFSILLDAFAKHGQTAAAAKVLTLMRQRGLKPEQVTYNSLIKGFATVRDVEGMAGALRGLEKDGFKVDNAVVAAFRKVGGKEALQKAWENQRRLEEGEYEEYEVEDQEQDGHEAEVYGEEIYATETFGLGGKEHNLGKQRRNGRVNSGREGMRNRGDEHGIERTTQDSTATAAPQVESRSLPRRGEAEDAFGSEFPHATSN